MFNGAVRAMVSENDVVARDDVMSLAAAVVNFLSHYVARTTLHIPTPFSAYVTYPAAFFSLEREHLPIALAIIHINDWTETENGRFSGSLFPAPAGKNASATKTPICRASFL